MIIMRYHDIVDNIELQLKIQKSYELQYIFNYLYRNYIGFCIIL